MDLLTAQFLTDYPTAAILLSVVGLLLATAWYVHGEGCPAFDVLDSGLKHPSDRLIQSSGTRLRSRIGARTAAPSRETK